MIVEPIGGSRSYYRLTNSGQRFPEALADACIDISLSFLISRLPVSHPILVRITIEPATGSASSGWSMIHRPPGSSARTP